MSDKAPWESLEGYQEFMTFATQDDAAKVNAPGAKDYVSTKDAKNWFDPNPEDGQGGKFTFDIGDTPHVLYPRAFFGKLNPDQTGILSSLVIPVNDAKRVNIILTGTGMTNVPATGKSTPVPLKALGANQVILRQTPFSPFMVRNTDVPLAGEQQQQGNDAVVAALASIEAKVNKILVKFGIA